jgi:putative transposase
VSVGKLCGKVGMTAQNYYKGKCQRQVREVDEALVVDLVKMARREHPRMGGRKLCTLLAPELADAGVEIGRDRLFGVLRRHGLLVDPLPKSPRTTDSRHCLPVFRNLIAGLEATGPNQIWASDITYVRLDGGFAYLSLITDLHSRMIVGHHCCETLESLGCVKALDAALATLPADRYPIHHSDRGCQYCCHDYVDRLVERALPVSMTEANHCYENACAERVNGILKQEYGLRMTFRDIGQARKAVDEAVWLYNCRRPHMSLGYRVPADVHARVA